MYTQMYTYVSRALHDDCVGEGWRLDWDLKAWACHVTARSPGPGGISELEKSADLGYLFRLQGVV